MMGMQMMPMLMQMQNQQQMMGQQQMNQPYQSLPGMFGTNAGQAGLGYGYADMLKNRDNNDTPWYQKLFSGLQQVGQIAPWLGMLGGAAGGISNAASR